MAIGGEHIQKGTGRKLRYWVTFKKIEGHLKLFGFSAVISDGDRLVQLTDGEFYCRRGLPIEDAVRQHLKEYIDATALGEGKAPDPAWLNSHVHVGPWR